MIPLALSAALLTLALLATLRAVTASSTERLLWGSLGASAGLGLAVELRGGGYYGILMVAVFVVTDLMLYLFFRSLRLLPDKAAQHARGDRAYRMFFLWLSLCAMAGVLVLAFAPTGDEIWSAPPATAIGLLYERVWAGDWILAALPVLGLVALVTGGFFLVRRESQ
jgi:hypothetical protein